MKRESVPRWFHRANWAGGALACCALALAPLWWWGPSFGAWIWGAVWLVLGAGAANNARLGVDSLNSRARFRRLRWGSGPPRDPRES